MEGRKIQRQKGKVKESQRNDARDNKAMARDEEVHEQRYATGRQGQRCVGQVR